MRIAYLGHATVRIELDDVVFLTDPLLRPRLAHLRRLPAPPAPAELARLDAILVSHSHHDHLDVASLRSIGSRPPVICPPSARSAVSRAGLRPRPVSEGETVDVAGIRVTAVHADHDGRRWPKSSRREALGYLLSGRSSRVYFAGDTGYFEDMGRISVDVALLPIAGWGPRLPPGHLDPEEAARAAADIRPRLVIPIHWGTYRRMMMRTREAPDAPAAEFRARLRELAPEVEAKILPPGAAVQL